MGIRELRDKLPQAIRRVRGGETIAVTNDGEPVALIVPYPQSKLDLLIAQGKATPGRRPFRPPTRLFEAKGPITASQILEEDRADR